mgnify:FL=1
MGLSLEKSAKVALYIFIAAAVLFVLYLVKGVLLPFVIGIVLTYLLYPIVRIVEKVLPGKTLYPKLSRGIAIAIVYLLAIVLLVVGFLLIIPPLFSQSTDLIGKLPVFVTEAINSVEGWNKEYSNSLPEPLQYEIGGILAAIGWLIDNLGVIVLSYLQSFIGRVAVAAVHAFSLVIGLIVVPIFVFYLLKDREKVRDSVIDVFPSDSQIHVVHILRILNRVVGAYVRAQVTLAAVVGVFISVGLFLIGVDYAILLGVVAGMFEFIPIIGAWLGFIPALVVVLSTSPDKFIWILLLYAGVQLMQGAFLVPRIQSFAIKIHPLLILVSILIGSEVGGLWGVILGPPIAASVKELIVYFSNIKKNDEVNEVISTRSVPNSEEVTDGTQ